MMHTSVHRQAQIAKAAVYIQTIDLVAQWLADTGHADLVEPMLDEFTEDAETLEKKPT
jgi:hypothetical protein